ncbi:LON peptidase N-terminal domain and RING finger protein 2 isoform X3 [Cricetulus griseus]|uniref:LON peptidase N-terminal domain and RING finger protein 2 isoform X3 n=2 Tax=Cricetulus griseus TaxID=10029 RepID=A0A9J7KFS4_CRIGR|nr:LON peptidase N-terminal domain and RING finger protein 2 isoform X3 [Cricetulus griseus]
MSPEPASQPPDPQGVSCSLEEPPAEHLDQGSAAFLAGDYEEAAELFRSLLAGLAQPERGLCLQLGDALSRAGRLPEAIGAFRGAALLGPLKPEELEELASGLARALGLREKRPPAVVRPGFAAGSPVPMAPRDLLGCPRCGRLLYKPVTLASGLTVCKRCVELVPGRAQARRVNVVLSGLVERCFPAECRLRKLACQARGLQRQQQPEAALLRCQQALDMAPDDNLLLLLRAELYLTMKNYEQALRDADAVCQREPLLTKGHHIKAQILSGLGRSKEVLKEFIYCLALNPECNSAKKETQKVICEVFFPASENEHQNSTAPTQIGPKAHCDDQMNPQHPLEEGSDANTGSSENPSEKSDVLGNASSSVLYFILGLHCEEDKKALEGVIPAAPSSTLKRQLPSDTEDECDRNTPEKVPKKDSSPQGNVNSLEEPEFTIDVTDFECALCMRLLFEPVTTPCGHTFCLKCLERCLDHAPHCPLCKDKLSELLATRNFNVTVLTEELMFRYLPEELSARKRTYDEEMSELSNLTRDVPIFVCAMAFPTVPCPLHVFEPRYRLMIRRCMETGTKRFGMCLSAENAGISEYGCMLEIKDVRTFPDGSSVVDAVGISRFRVLNHRHRDGYNTADIEYLEDEKVEGAEYEELAALHESVYQQSVSWFASLQDHMKKQILSHFGSMPEREPEPQSNSSGPAWSWWILAVLPLERKAQLAILGMASLKERLLAIRRILVIITRKMNSRQEMANNAERDN